MKKIILYTVFSLLIAPAFAQNLIAVQNGSTPAFYTKLTDALSYAQSGDTIYIPGGSFESVSINKEIHLIGVGANPDSTFITNRTVISGLNLQKGSDNGSIQGCHLSGQCSISEGIDRYSITRCYINKGISFNADAAHFLITENILGGFGDGCLYGGFHSIVLKGSGHIVANNIIKADIISSGGNVFENNVFLYSTTWCQPLSCSYEKFYNNIFLSGGQGTTNCIAKNNLGYFYNDIDGRNNQGTNNYSIGSSSFDEVFVSFSVANGWSFSSDLHLKPDSPYRNAGTDGTDIGIYGGAFPWKEGSVPSNPHFKSVKINPKTDNSGNLNVKIKVAAQDN